MNRKDRKLEARDRKDREIAARSILTSLAQNFFYELHLEIARCQAAQMDVRELAQLIQDRFRDFQARRWVLVTQNEINWYLDWYGLPR